ncbi:MAG: ROK family protein [Aquificae bacterium]|nr:ROK family protein [Aquificota bacterium]
MGYLGIDIGGSFIKYCGKTNGEIKKGKIPTERNLDSVLFTLKEVVEKFNPERVGFGVAGLYDKKTGVITASPNIKHLEGINLKGVLEGYLNVPVVIHNDGSAAAFGEYHYGAGKGAEVLVCFTLGTGLGGGLVIGGNLVEGVSGCGMEIGHTTVNVDGWYCHCGRKGCLEAYASSYGLERFYFLLTDKKLSSAEIILLANGGDREAIQSIEEFSRYLAVGLMNALHIFNPDRIVVGGGIPEHYPVVIDMAVANLKEMAFHLPFRDVQVLKAGLGEYSGAYGAMVLAEIGK